MLIYEKRVLDLWRKINFNPLSFIDLTHNCEHLVKKTSQSQVKLGSFRQGGPLVHLSQLVDERFRQGRSALDFFRRILEELDHIDFLWANWLE